MLNVMPQNLFGSFWLQGRGKSVTVDSRWGALHRSAEFLDLVLIDGSMGYLKYDIYKWLIVVIWNY